MKNLNFPLSNDKTAMKFFRLTISDDEVVFTYVWETNVKVVLKLRHKNLFHTDLIFSAVVDSCKLSSVIEAAASI